MDISDIVTRNRAAAEQKALEQEATRAIAAQDEKTLQRLHVERLQEALKGIVEPVLKEGALQLKQNGYVTATVARTFSEDPIAGMRNVIVEVQLNTQGQNTVSRGTHGFYAIRYNADVQTFHVTCSFEINGQHKVAEDGRNITLAELSIQLVESQFRRFVDEATRADFGG